MRAGRGALCFGRTCRRRYANLPAMGNGARGIPAFNQSNSVLPVIASSCDGHLNAADGTCASHGPRSRVNHTS